MARPRGPGAWGRVRAPWVRLGPEAIQRSGTFRAQKRRRPAAPAAPGGRCHDIPNLPAEPHRILLTTLADDVTAVPRSTGRRRQSAYATPARFAGAPIGRASVNTVIAGVLYAGLDLT